LAVVSHDLRNPLTAILLGAAVLRETAGALAVSLGDYVDAIERPARLMSRLISDLLDMSRIESGRVSIALLRYPASALVGEVIALFASVAEEKVQRLLAEVVEECDVTCDRDRAVQILSNLVGNALKFTPEGGTVTIRLERAKVEAIFTVVDDGPGIPAEQLPHLFQRFWQAEPGQAGGLGLGLYIAKGLAEAHSGRLWVESEPGSGSSFSFTLPLCCTSARPASPA
jgi:signal transduction histidine kinase